MDDLDNLWRYHTVYALTSVNQVPGTGGYDWYSVGNNEAILKYEYQLGIEENEWYIEDITCTGESQRVKIELELWSSVYEGSVEKRIRIYRGLVREGPYEEIMSFLHTVRADHPEDLYITLYDSTVEYQMTYWYRATPPFGCWLNVTDDAIPYDLEPADNQAVLYDFTAEDNADDHGGAVNLEWSTSLSNQCYYVYRKPNPGEGEIGEFNHIATAPYLYHTDSYALTGWDVEYKIVGFDGVAVTDPVFASCEPEDNLAPQKITGLTGYWEPNEKTVYLEWNPVLSANNEPNLGGYWVCPIAVSPEGDSVKGNLNNISPIERLWYQEKRDDPVGTDLVYKVAAMDRSGNVGQWSDEYVITVTSGCPFLYAWDGDDLVEDNNILPTAEMDPGEDVTDNYLLEKPLEEQEEGYVLKIAEYENEHTYLNQIKLKTVDHPSNVDVVVIQDGKILSIENETPPLSCSDDKGKDQKSKVSEIDGECYITEEGSHLIVTIDSTISSPVIHPWITLKAPYLPQLKVADGDTWSDISPVLSRWNWSEGGVALPQGTYRIKIEFFDDHRLDFLGVASCSENDVTVQECSLTVARDSKNNSVKDELIEVDDKYAELTTDDFITAYFDVPDKEQGVERDFVFISTGYFTKDGGGGGQTADDNKPHTYSLSLYPNPTMNEINITFGIPKDGGVSLKVYDVSGRVVKTLVNDNLDAGNHIVRADYKNLCSGIYFVKLVTDKFEETKKLVVMR